MRTTVQLVIAIATSMLACSAQDRDADETKPGSFVAAAPPGSDRSDESAPGSTSSPAPSSSSPSPPSSPPPPAMKVTQETIEVMGSARDFVLAVPASYTAARAYPLVLVLHGDGGDGASMRAALPFDDQSGGDAVVVYPSGKGKGWNLYAPAAENEDFGYIQALLETLRGRLSLDPKRVFATGFSSGAFMANQLACRTTLLRGIASHGGGAPDEPQDPSAATWPNGYARCANQASGVAVLVVHGMDDHVVDYPSGEFTASYWSYVNGCAEGRAATMPPPCVRDTACPSDKPVVFCPIAGLGHTIWHEAAKTDWAFFSGL